MSVAWAKYFLENLSDWRILFAALTVILIGVWHTANTQRLYATLSLLSNLFMQIYVMSVTNMETGAHEAFRESWPIADAYANEIANNPADFNAVVQLGLTNNLPSLAMREAQRRSTPVLTTTSKDVMLATGISKNMLTSTAEQLNNWMV